MKLLALLFVAIMLPAYAVDPVAQRAVPVSQVTAEDAFLIFGGSMKQWDNGTRIVIYNQDPDSISVKLFAMKIRIPPTQLTAAIAKNINDGADIRVVDTPNQMLLAVANTPNSAGIYNGGSYVQNINGIKLMEIK